MSKFVPVVIYSEGERIVVGEGEIQEDGSIKAFIRTKEIAEGVAKRLPWEIVIAPLPLNLRCNACSLGVCSAHRPEYQC